MNPLVRTLKKQTVVFTGALAGMTQGDAGTAVARSGGSTNDHVTSQTTILVRGQSSLWLFRDYGIKEQKAAEFIREGFDIAIINAEDFLTLLTTGKPVSPSKSVAGIPVTELLAQRDEASCRHNLSIPDGDLDRWTETKTRVEQAKLRTLHLDGKTEAKCSICGNRFPASLLRTSHLKRRSECSAKERRDVTNIVMLMCEIGCDALYEKGFLTVDRTGEIVLSRHGEMTEDLRKKLKHLKGKVCQGYHEGRENYFHWHRTTVFLG